MVSIEVIQEVASDDLAGCSLAAERICDKLEVFFQRFLSVNGFDPLHKTSGDVIVEIVIITDGNDIVRVNREGLIVILIDLVIIGAIGDRTIRVLLCELFKLRSLAVKRLCGLLDLAVPGKNQTGLIQRIPPEHTSYGVGNEGTNISSKISLSHSDILVLNFGRKFSLQSVDVNEDTVEFFLVSF